MAKKAAKRKKRGGNMSRAIRDYITEHPDLGPTAVADALNAREGWSMTPGYVSTIKNKMKTSSAEAAVARESAGEPHIANVDTGAVLMTARELTKQAGGFDKARAALELLAKLRD